MLKKRSVSKTLSNTNDVTCRKNISIKFWEDLKYASKVDNKCAGFLGLWQIKTIKTLEQFPYGFFLLTLDTLRSLTKFI